MGKYAATALLSAVVSAMLVSAFWIWFYNFVPAGAPAILRSGNIVAVVPPKASPVAVAEQVVVGPSGLAIPVVGVKADQLTDTFDQARASGRRHDAIDIMAAEGTPVIAAADGTIEKLFFSRGGGGITIYERSPDQKWTYYYAHLSAYAPGLAEGQQVKRGAYMQVEMKNLIDGRKTNVRFRSAETVERVRLDTKDYQYLYHDGDMLVFMDKDTYEQVSLPEDLIGEPAAFLQDGMDVVMELYDERPISVQLPDQIEATIVEADAVVKGQTASSSYKPAKLDNGVKVLVPPHITAGTKIVVDVYNREYVRRAD